MAEFQLNGGAFGNLLNPGVSFNGQDVYGRQRSQLVLGEQSDWTLTWGELSDTAFTELKSRIDGAAGARVAITLPYTSATAWSSFWAHVRLASFSRRGFIVENVVVEVIGASTSL